MARTKATVTLDREKAALAQEVLGAASMSDAIDMALDRLLQTEQLRRDIAAYRQVPPTAEEIALGELAVVFDLADDDIDYESLYGGKR